MRVVKIDPKAKTVEFHELPDKRGQVENKDIYESLGCEYMQFINIMPHVLLIIDEEGLRKFNHHWATNDFNAYAGIGLLCGWDPETEDLLPVPDNFNKADLMRHILWIGDDQKYERAIQQGLFRRPKQELIAGNERQTLWEWTPHEPDRPHYNN